MLMLGFFFVLFLQQSSVLFQSVFVFAPIRICICSSGPRAEEVTHLARRSRTKRFARCLAYLECTLCTGRYSVHCICIFHTVYVVLHTLSVYRVMQCALYMYFSLGICCLVYLECTLSDTVFDQCTLYCTTLCVVHCVHCMCVSLYTLSAHWAMQCNAV